MLRRYGTKGLMSIGVVLIAIVVHGCALQAATKPEAATTPPEGAVTAELGFPPVGTTWVYKTVEHGTEFRVTRTIAALGERMHDGRPVYRTTDGALFDKATRNWTATVKGRRERRSASPYVPTYAFPLWVGKSWKATYTYHDHERGDTYTNIHWRGKVSAYEDVTVPAGTFKAFKVEGRDSNIQLVSWYAPTLHMDVQAIMEYVPGHALNPGQRTADLVTYTPK